MSKKAYPHQVSTAYEIVRHYENGKMNFLVVARTQLGKTGCAAEVIYIMRKKGLVKFKNVFVITNLNDSSWDTTMFDRFPAAVRRNIYRRQSYDKLVRKFKKIPKGENKIFIIDEPQVGSGINQSITYLNQKLGLNSKQEIYDNNCAFIQLSATFDKASIREAVKDPNFTQLIHMPVPKEYHGFKQLDVRDYPMGWNSIDDFNADLDLFGDDNPKYHLVRIRWNSRDRRYINSQCPFLVDYCEDNEGCDRCETIMVGSTNKDEFTIKEFEKMLYTKPKQHTIVYIKMAYRASNTLCKQHLGHCYDYIAKTINDSVIVQSFSGRCCGYNCSEYYNGPSLIRTNRDSCELYEQNIDDYVTLLKKGFCTTKRDKFNRETFNNVKNISNKQIYTEVNFFDVIDEKEYIKNLEDFKNEVMDEKEFGRNMNLGQQIKEYFFEHINTFDDDLESKILFKTRILISPKYKNMFRIKVGRKENILTKKNYMKKNIVSGIKSFHCLPVYENNNPDSVLSFIFIHAGYASEEQIIITEKLNIQKETMKDEWLKTKWLEIKETLGDVEDLEKEEFEKYYEKNRYNKQSINKV